MKAETLKVLRRFWRFLTIIPGWPDAGRLARTAYALPLAIPFSGLLLLWAGDTLVRRPAIEAVRDNCAPAEALEAEVDSLGYACSDAQVAETAAAVAALEAGVVGDPAQLQVLMDRMRATATAKGWSVALIANEPELPAPGAPRSFVFQTLRGRVTPLEGGGDFRTLLGLLEEFVPAEVRGGVSRVAIRADEQGRLAADIGVRLAVSPPDEKTP